ncbi:MAG: Rieske 2Fe-2S domain-containing protein [Nocardioidaceae bacterium]
MRQPGWLLLPLRAFLGVTFTFAGLQKLASPSFFDASSPTSVQQQMQSVAPTSPIGPLVQLSLHAGVLVGLLIALAELAVGVGTLLGLKIRLAAVGGAVLALSFFLTVSWNTAPYYYGADIVFLFAWTPFIAMGAGDVLSVDAWIAGNALGSDRPDQSTGSAAARQRERRALLSAGAVTALAAGATALAGRLVAGPSTTRTASLGGTQTGGRPPAGGRTKSAQKHPQAPAGMTRIGSANAVPVGQAAEFRDPANGNPAWLVRSAQDTYAAFSAVCTHAGCAVQYSASNSEFVCPCHGGLYSAKTGQVLAGPPPAPLPPVRVHVVDGQVYAV